MFENLLKNPELKKLKYFIVFMFFCICVYAYAGVSGWKFTGSSSEKWQPAGNSNHYHK